MLVNDRSRYCAAMDIFFIFLVLFFTVKSNPIQSDIQDDDENNAQDLRETTDIQPGADTNYLTDTTSNLSDASLEPVVDNDLDLFASAEKCGSAIQRRRKTRDLLDANGINTDISQSCRNPTSSNMPEAGESTEDGKSSDRQSSNGPAGMKENQIVKFKPARQLACCYNILKQQINDKINWGKCRKFDLRYDVCKDKSRRVRCKEIHLGVILDFNLDQKASDSQEFGWGEDCL